MATAPRVGVAGVVASPAALVAAGDALAAWARLEAMEPAEATSAREKAVPVATVAGKVAAPEEEREGAMAETVAGKEEGEMVVGEAETVAAVASAATAALVVVVRVATAQMAVVMEAKARSEDAAAAAAMLVAQATLEDVEVLLVRVVEAAVTAAGMVVAVAEERAVAKGWEAKGMRAGSAHTPPRASRRARSPRSPDASLRRTPHLPRQQG